MSHTICGRMGKSIVWSGPSSSPATTTTSIVATAPAHIGRAAVVSRPRSRVTNCSIFANARSSSGDEQGTDNQACAAASCSDLDVFTCQSNRLENKKQHVLSNEPNNKQQHQQQQQQQPDVQQQTQLHGDQQSAQSSRSQCVTPQAPARPPPPKAQGSFSMNAAADWDEGYVGEPQQAPPAAELQDLPPMLPSRQEWQEAAASTGVQPQVPIASDVQRRR